MHPILSHFIAFAFCINYCANLNLLGKYNGFTLYRAMPTEQKHMDFLQNISSNYKIIFWKPPGTLYQPVDFVVAPDDKKKFLIGAENVQLFLTPKILDVSFAFAKQRVKPYIKRKLESFDWRSYFKLKDIYQWLQDLAEAYPGVMELQSIGTTYENRKILLVKIILPGSKERSRVFIEGGIHGREWISPAVVTYLLNQVLFSANSNDVNLKSIGETYVWYFVPVLNPDGYEYTHTMDRLWRKNRNNGSSYNGIDLNRNFWHAFGTVGTSTNKDSDYYCGPRPFSEKESRSLANYLRTMSSGLEYYLSFHAYGQSMIIPYSNVMDHLDNYDDVLEMCQKAKLRIASKFNTPYTIGNNFETLGFLASGDTNSWIKSRFKVPYVINFNLRDTGETGFALPASLILPTCKETLDAVVSILIPRTTNFTSQLRECTNCDSGSAINIFDKIVFIFTVFVFIIVTFD